jgi:hypothetical protein
MVARRPRPACAWLQRGTWQRRGSEAAASRWSTRLIAQMTGLAQTATVRIWRIFRLPPHRSENFQVASGRQFVGQVQPLNRAQPIVAMAIGMPAALIARLRTPWSHFASCGTGCDRRSRDRQLLSTTPPPGVPAVPHRHRMRLGRLPARSRPLHAHQQQSARHGGAIVCRSDRAMRPMRKSPGWKSIGECDAAPLGLTQPGTQAIPVESGRGPDFEQSRAVF